MLRSLPGLSVSRPRSLRRLPPRSNRGQRRFFASNNASGTENGNVSELLIDASKLKSRHDHTHDIDGSKKSKKTPLVDQLISMIRIRGPITVASFMRQCLTHPQYGYYMRRDVFGRGGDFITSPEISQMFGELLGIWAVSLWRDLGCPKPFRLVELGPGRGTLTADLLKVAKKFREFNAAISIHFVEVSPTLRDIQASKLGLKYPEQKAKSASPKLDSAVLLPNDSSSRGMKVQRGLDQLADFSDLLEDVQLKTSDGVEVFWHQRVQDIPAGPSAIIAQEFFDALPVHQFEYTKDGWRERLVDIDPTPDGPHWFRYTLAPSASFASTSFLKNLKTDKRFKVGDTIEVSPDSMGTAQIIGNRLARDGGAAVIIDYGENGAPAFSLRAIKDHKFVDIFQEPGDADLSVNVDFAAVKNSAKQSLTKGKDGNPLDNGVVARGPITQSEFLSNLGLEVRIAKLLREATNEEDAQALISSFHRLVAPEEMGTSYKVISLSRLHNSEWNEGFSKND